MSSPTATASSSLVAQGFHFTFSTEISVLDPGAAGNCSLHLVHVLPRDVYADPYELSQRPGYAASLNAPVDLELPVAAVAPADTILTLEVTAPPFRGAHAVSVDVPLHARYGAPAASQPGYHTIALPSPRAFWACPRPAGAPAALPAALAPFLPPGAYATSDVMLIPQASPEMHELRIPVGRLDDLAIVDVGTAGVMLLMFVYLATVSVRAARRLHARPATDSKKE
ncbi:hypothetical protein WOLCODRAFT_149727 [Wolfiporia cocos MD-104 SS10]|uniref:Protein PBN1 n=1 Tax=Wolfiporia cocos (strain MD-104) TaxID=742152 RepID=A0A2H3JRY7_WOLCO|nr:hypothetical protein WOLCODRAFT_149727 [Wolfiporia cocos MD-104 SS10]